MPFSIQSNIAVRQLAVISRAFAVVPAVFLASLLIWGASALALDTDLMPGSTDSPSEEKTDPLSAEGIASRLSEVEHEQQALKPVAGSAGAEIAVSKLEKLAQIERIIAMQSTVAEGLYQAPLPADEAAQPEPTSIFALNTLYESLNSAQVNVEERGLNLAAAKERLAAARKKLSSLKISKDNAQPDEQAALTSQIALAALAVRVDQEEVYLATLEVRKAGGAGGVDRLNSRIQVLRAQLATAKAAPVDALDKLEIRIARSKRQESLTEANFETVQLRLAAAQQRLSSGRGDSAQALIEVESLSTLRDIIRERITIYSSERERLEGQKPIWQHWQGILAGMHSREEVRAWQKEAAQRLEGLRLDEVQAQTRISDLENRIEALEARQLAAEPSNASSSLYQEVDAQIERLQSDQLNVLRGLGVDSRLTERLLAEIQAETGDFNLLEWGSKSIDSVLSLWNYEITTIDDAPFTLGSLTIGLTLFGSGIWVSRRASNMVGRFAKNRLNLDAGASQAIQSLSFYAMLIGISLLALRTIHFPLTAFAFLGGALAIGVGFGSQNVMNNFISGLILMLERPVRAADVVEVDGNHGTIEHIGARSTQIRSNDGRHIVVPNSFFLESNVINWTLSDDLIRAKVAVGVAYGSPTELVAKLIEEVVEAEKNVLADPKPILIFESFGDNSLNFETHFWVSARSPMGVRQIESKVRFAIDRVFRENDVVISFPQRDVHLDSMSPIEVRMVSQDAAGNPMADDVS